jgi:hypothetical protein
MRPLLILTLLIQAAAQLGAQAPAQAKSPYPPSSVVKSIEWNLKSHIQHGLGSDQWPLTWADDDNIYSGWGDGWGWNKKGPKYSLGITRISGNPPALRGEDLWGVGPGAGVAKAEALIAYGGKIYMFWTMGRSKVDSTNTGFAVSSDNGVTWKLEEKKMFADVPDGFRVRGIAQFGKGYAGAMDDYIYVYFGFSRADDIYLARVAKAAISDAQRYEWFAGTTGGQPVWKKEFAQKKPAFTDPNGYVWHVGVAYNPGIGRFLLTKPHNAPGGDRKAPEGDRTKVAGLGIFDAPKPWGPWTTVYYKDNFFDSHFKFTFFIPGKYLSSDGKSLWLVWSGYPEYDNVNFIHGEMSLSK